MVRKRSAPRPSSRRESPQHLERSDRPAGRDPDQDLRAPCGRQPGRPVDPAGRGRRPARARTGQARPRPSTWSSVWPARTAGKVFLGDEDITALPMYLRARAGIGYLPQEASVFRKLTAEENVLAILETRGLPAGEQHSLARQLLEELGIQPMARQPAYTLSGGERRRLEICRALAASPSFILLDEPFAGIDPLAVHRHPEDHRPPAQARDRHPHHRPQRPRDLENHRPRLYSSGTAMSFALAHLTSWRRTPRSGASTWAKGFRLEGRGA